VACGAVAGPLFVAAVSLQGGAAAGLIGTAVFSGDPVGGHCGRHGLDHCGSLAAPGHGVL